MDWRNIYHSITSISIRKKAIQRERHMNTERERGGWSKRQHQEAQIVKCTSAWSMKRGETAEYWINSREKTNYHLLGLMITYWLPTKCHRKRRNKAAGGNGASSGIISLIDSVFIPVFGRFSASLSGSVCPLPVFLYTANQPTIIPKRSHDFTDEQTDTSSYRDAKTHRNKYLACSIKHRLSTTSPEKAPEGKIMAIWQQHRAKSQWAQTTRQSLKRQSFSFFNEFD